MYDRDKFTQLANISIDDAIEFAGNMGHTYVGTEHLLLGILNSNNSDTSKLLYSYNVDRVKVEDAIKKSIGTNDDIIKLNFECVTPVVHRVLNYSLKIAKKCNHNFTSTLHILKSILMESNCTALLMLQSLNVNTKQLCKDCDTLLDNFYLYHENIATKPKNNKSKLINPINNIDTRDIPNLIKYGKNLTDIAYKKGFDPVIDRDKEIDRLIQILSRRTKNNPCLIGEPGVGKTAIVEGLAQMIVRGEVPDDLKTKNIFALDMSVLIAGTRYRGDFEERLNKCINEVITSKHIILFIDEIHTIVGTGAAEGAIDASNVLKPKLARGEIQLIGATTIDEYRKNIEKDKALERRFQTILIDEPNKNQTLNIMKGIRSNYEKYHNVKISDEILNLAINYSIRYINDRYLPDKAIDLLDEACSRAKLRLSHINKISQEIINSVDVTKGDICNVVSTWSGVPIDKTSKEDDIKLLELEDNIKKVVIGQDKAINSISNAIIRNKCGLRDEKRPISSFLFLGSTGVGKTELSKVLANELFDSEDNLIRFDMSEYMEKHSVSKLIGSPPGYVGCEDGGQLTEQVRLHPYSIVLFDEIEKANSDVLNLLLQILDEGYLTDSNGRKVNFRNTVIIITSNIGSDIFNKNSIGFNQDNINKTIEHKIIAEAKHYFKPELLNRIDDIIVFNKLTINELELITTKLLNELKTRANDNLGIELSFDDSVIKLLATDISINNEYGARPLKRKIMNTIETPLSKQIMLKQIKSGDKINIYVDNGQIIFNNCDIILNI